MALPAENTPWPPTRDLPRYSKMRTASIWYEGDPERLSGLYQGGVVESTPAVSEGRLTRAYRQVYKWFWGSPPTAGEKDNKIHVPIAQDIATLSSELLFAEPPTVKLDVPPVFKDKEPPAPSPVSGTLPPDPITGEVPEVGAPPVDANGEVEQEEVEDPKAVQAQETLEWLLDRVGFQSLCLAAAETQSPLGSVCLRVAFDKEIDAQAPFLTRVDADSAVPEYRWGKLVALTFWTVIATTGQGKGVVRLLERYEPGRILYGLYQGSAEYLGKRIPYTDYPETAWIADIPGLVGDEVPAPEGTLMATSVPNALPDPSDRQSAIGRSDLTPGVLSLMDAVDEIATSLMRDIHLGKGRVFLARYMLEDNGAGRGASFNEDQAYFSPLRMNPGEKDEAPITANQFKIRVEEHLKAIEWYSAKAVRAAGYNPDADFGDDGGDMTATEYSGRNKRSFSTRAKKVLYWTQALELILEALVKTFNENFAVGAPGAAEDAKPPIPEEWPIKVEFPPAAHPDIKYLAEVAGLMKTAEAASMKVRVELLHPEWSEREVAEEVARIEEEATAAAAIDPATFGLAPGDENAPEISTPSPFNAQDASAADAGLPNPV